MLYRKLNFVSLFMLCITFMMVMEGASTGQTRRAPKRRNRPYFHEKFNIYSLPPSLQASFDGSMSGWPNEKIIASLNDVHPKSGDNLLHIVCNISTLNKILRIKEGSNLLSEHNKFGNRPIHQIAFRNNPLLMNVLLTFLEKKGLLSEQIDAPNLTYQDSPLHVAVAHGKWRSAETLIAFGANLQQCNKQNENAQDIINRISTHKGWRDLSNFKNEYAQCVAEGLSLRAQRLAKQRKKYSAEQAVFDTEVLSTPTENLTAGALPLSAVVLEKTFDNTLCMPSMPEAGRSHSRFFVNGQSIKSV